LLRAGVVVIGVLVSLAPLHDLIVLTTPAAGFMALLAAWLTLFDARRRGEALFLADLGVPSGVLVLVALGPPAAGEAIVRLLSSL
jgi:hypothetical protein